MNQKVFAGGVPTDPEIRRIRDEWPDASLAHGQVIADEDVARVTGARPDSTRFETITTRWRRLVEDNTGHVIGRQDGNAFRVLTEAEKLDLSEKKLLTSARHARRSYVICGRVNIRDLTDDERNRAQRIHDYSAAVITAAQARSKTQLPKFGEK